MHFRNIILVLTFVLIIGYTNAIPIPSSNLNSTISISSVGDNIPKLPNISVNYGSKLSDVENPIDHYRNYEIKPLGEGICDYYNQSLIDDALVNDNINLVDNELVDFDKISDSLKFDDVKNGTNYDIVIGNPYKDTNTILEEKFTIIFNETSVAIIDLNNNVQYLIGELSKPVTKTYNRLEREGYLNPDTYTEKYNKKSKTLTTLIQRIIKDAKFKHESDVQRRHDRKQRWKNRKAEYDSYNTTSEYIVDKVTEKATNYYYRHDLDARTHPLYITVKVVISGPKYLRYTRNFIINFIIFKIKLSYSTASTTLDLFFRYLSVME
ncbi:putative secreted protein [Wickerhamomyces ciferrii]|uniref:Secreted protein n=1 Tax=Wickerhamomyces ciferrii (strain ATCC 14091 / BCRC 22168 / CBS 111 / JCM 3599 / NBRC 0793 / NRRL Y-1031 F-60-10) TaxID=1206466 RepID=K0KT32_WICCF|nr:uncharacterized protein BN7_4042 [Wickerhamomyces ciferrii]CCH44478.1 putative secreted protein [Wickerhamomyces ciferrii]